MPGQMHAMRLNLTEEIEDNSAEVAERTAELNEKIAEQEAAKEAVDKEVADLMARLEDVESKIEKLVSDQTTTADKREGLADLASKAGALAGLERSTTNLKQQKAEMVEQFENQKKEITEDRTVAVSPRTHPSTPTPLSRMSNQPLEECMDRRRVPPLG